MGMVKVSKSVIKVVTYDQPKRLRGWSQKAMEAGCASLKCGIVDHMPLGREQAPNLTYSCKRNLATPYILPFGGKRAVRRADGGAGMGGRKKQKPSCNGSDRGPIPRRESALTSDWSFDAKR